MATTPTPSPSPTPDPSPSTQATSSGQALSPDKSTDAAAPQGQQGSGKATALKSIVAILAGGGLAFLTGLGQGQSPAASGISAGAAALATLIAYLTKSPIV
ncbi:MAG: hypothetical protein JO345_21930 [Streptosporangiaceae bacterium]|nr:hypothetical protein [Streptosporangiaceae bacterium]